MPLENLSIPYSPLVRFSFQLENSWSILKPLLFFVVLYMTICSLVLQNDFIIVGLRWRGDCVGANDFVSSVLTALMPGRSQPQDNLAFQLPFTIKRFHLTYVVHHSFDLSQFLSPVRHTDSSRVSRFHLVI